MSDLIERLRSGIPVAGETIYATDLYDFDAAETTMAEAADEIERLQILVELLNKDVAYWVDRCDEAETSHYEK